MRLGLCCQFAEEPIKFRQTTATALRKLSRTERDLKLSDVALHNASSLLLALEFCAKSGIGAFRVTSKLLPLRTHPEVPYAIEDLPRGRQILDVLRACGQFASRAGLRVSFHPDQFVVLGSPHEHVVESSIDEIEYQAEVSEWIGADVITIHVGGASGGKEAGLERLRRNLDRLSAAARERLTVENDDRIYTPLDLFEFCEMTGVPLVYDVHHHRCLPDGWPEKAAWERALETWRREPVLHVSSPDGGWSAPKPQRHAEHIDPRDFPREWTSLEVTVDVEARAKELAVIRLRDELGMG